MAELSKIVALSEKDQALAQAKDRTLRLFRFLEAYNLHRSPVKTRIDQYPWAKKWVDLPSDPSLRFCSVGNFLEDSPRANAEAEVVDQATILSVKRPICKECPKPPNDLLEWLNPGWDDPEKSATVRKSINRERLLNASDGEEEQSSETLEFNSNPKLKEDFEAWGASREKWKDSEIPVRRTMALYEAFYEWHNAFRREPDKYEIVLADGILLWRTEEAGIIEHPLLQKRLELVFHPAIPEFCLVEADRPVEFNATLFSNINDIDGGILKDCSERAREGEIHPLSGAKTETFLRQVAATLSSRDAKGRFLESHAGAIPQDFPQVYRDSLLIIRERTAGFNGAIDSIIRDIDGANSLPALFYKVVGMNAPQEEEEAEKRLNEEEILLGKAANEEQIHIVEDLERYGHVLVQGPPGTGKSHTIANLIGHLLAHNKRVLVTSQNSKALRVLRDLIDESIRPLALSVLNDLSRSNKDLENSAMAIVDKLTEYKKVALSREVPQQLKNRKEIMETVGRLRLQLLESVETEYREIVVDGHSYRPAEAAKLIQDGIGVHDWMPRQRDPFLPLSLGQEEISFLYATNKSISPEEERMLKFNFPELVNAPVPINIESIFRDIRTNKENSKSEYSQFWIGNNDKPDAFSKISKLAEEAQRTLDLSRDWAVNAYFAGKDGGASLQPWHELLNAIARFEEACTRFDGVFLRLSPQIDESADIQNACQVLREIVQKTPAEDEVGFPTLLFHPAWKKVLSACLVNGRSPRRGDEVRAVLSLCEYIQEKGFLKQALLVLLKETGPVDFESPRGDILFQAKTLGNTITCCLSWWKEKWGRVIAVLDDSGFLTNQFIERKSEGAGFSRREFLQNSESILNEIVRSVVPEREAEFNLKLLLEEKNRYESLVQGYLEKSGSNPHLGQMFNALRFLDSDKYREGYSQLSDLLQKKEIASKRENLFRVLEKENSVWAIRIRGREGEHGHSEPPGDLKKAWLWNFLSYELDRISKLSIEKTQNELQKSMEMLSQTTKDVICKMSWLNQQKRMDDSQWNALVRYTDVVRAMGKGNVKGIRKLQAEAQKLLKQSSSVIPVWIMPLIKVAESFDPSKERFDVVIIDEASQCDLMSFIAVYMGKQVVIVGDHEQVTPSAVGQSLDLVHRLIDSHLYDVPGAITFDGRKSIYDIARGFGNTICLREHFRCVPEIIQFSNRLSYDNRILPLRESNSTHLKPPVIAYRVEDASCHDEKRKTNEKEAKVVASLVAAMSRHKAYTGKTIGVITLLGDEQAILIDRCIQGFMPADLYEKHSVICGNPYHLQGDERDVIVLSMVYGPSEDGPYRLNDGEGMMGMYKKRFNVAASRARDQMWVVHSLDPVVNFQPGDIRRQLLDYATDPTQWEVNRQDLEQKTESPFEKEVLNFLLNEGYEVVPQWKVGAFRIDMVVGSNGKRVAVECDGEKFHHSSTIQEDLSRQAILERLGWKFIRIRGSEFYRKRNQTTANLLSRLGLLGVERSKSGSMKGDDTVDLSLDTPLYNEISRLAFAIREGKASEAILNPSSMGTKEDLSKLGTEPVLEFNEQDLEEQDINDVQIPFATDRTKPEENTRCSGEEVRNDLARGPEAVAIPSFIEPVLLKSPNFQELSLLGPVLFEVNHKQEIAPNSVEEKKIDSQEAKPERKSRSRKADKNKNREKRKGTEEPKTDLKKKIEKVLELDVSPQEAGKAVFQLGVDFWFSMSKWGKATNKLNPAERSFAYQVGRIVANNWTLSEKQAAWAYRLSNKAVGDGFDSSEE